MIWEDWGLGIQDISQFWEIATPLKKGVEVIPKFHRQPIGAKGIGKLAFMMLGNKIDVETRTLAKAYYSDADFNSMKYFCLEREKPHEALSHVGTRIKISELKREIHGDEVIDYCKRNLYGLILSIASPHAITIFVNQIKVKPRSIEGTKGQIATPFGHIDCILTPTKTSSIDVLYRGVKVKEVNPAPTHPAEGYFNVDWLTPTSDRHDFADNEEYRLFYSEIRRYVMKNIPTKAQERPEEIRQTVRLLAKQVKEILREMGVLPPAMMPITSERSGDFFGSAEEPKLCQETEDHEPQEKEAREEHQREPQLRLHAKMLGGKKNTPLRTDYGINYLIDHAGTDKPPVNSYREDKYIIINLDHDLVKTSMTLNRNQRLVALAPLITRGVFHILEATADLNRYESFADNFLTKQYSKIASED